MNPQMDKYFLPLMLIMMIVTISQSLYVACINVIKQDVELLYNRSGINRAVFRNVPIL